jgi:hypothetical protein
VTLYVDAGWILHVQVEVSPPNTPIRDWGALQCMATRHRYERFSGETYYEEPETRAATFLQTALLLEPFSDYNATIGAGCADMYMEESGEPITPPLGGMPQLVREVRDDKASLSTIARRMRDWKA